MKFLMADILLLRTNLILTYLQDVICLYVSVKENYTFHCTLNNKALKLGFILNAGTYFISHQLQRMTPNTIM